MLKMQRKKTFLPLQTGVLLLLLLFITSTHCQLNLQFTSQLLSLPYSSTNSTYNFSITSNNYKITFIPAGSGRKIDCLLGEQRYDNCVQSEAYEVILASNIFYGEIDENRVVNGNIQTYISNINATWSGLYPNSVSFAVNDTYFAMQAPTKCSLLTEYVLNPGNWSEFNYTLGCALTQDGQTALMANSTGIQIRTLVDKLLGYATITQTNFDPPNSIYSLYGVSDISRDGSTIATSYTLANGTYSLIAIWKKDSSNYTLTGQTLLVNDSCPLKSLKFSRDGLRLLASTGNKYQFYTRTSTTSVFALSKTDTYQQTGSNPSTNCNNSIAQISQDGSIIAYAIANPNGSPVPAAQIVRVKVVPEPEKPDPALVYKVFMGIGLVVAAILAVALVCVALKYKKLKAEVLKEDTYNGPVPVSNQSGVMGVTNNYV